MAANKALERGSPLQFPMPSTVKSGDPVLVGKLACVANEDAKDPFGNVQPNVSCDLEGAFNLPVTAASALSPVTGSAVKPGDVLYYNGGTLDSVTNVTTGGTLSKDSTSDFGAAVVFGTALDPITSGQTKTIRVRLKENALG